VNQESEKDGHRIKKADHLQRPIVYRIPIQTSCRKCRRQRGEYEQRNFF
jgi:hypothetical protein